MHNSPARTSLAIIKCLWLYRVEDSEATESRKLCANIVKFIERIIQLIMSFLMHSRCHFSVSLFFSLEIESQKTHNVNFTDVLVSFFSETHKDS